MMLHGSPVLRATGAVLTLSNPDPEQVPGHHAVVPPAAIAPQLPDAQVARVRTRLLRRAGRAGVQMLLQLIVARINQVFQTLPLYLCRMSEARFLPPAGSGITGGHLAYWTNNAATSARMKLGLIQQERSLISCNPDVCRATPRSGCPATASTTCTQTHRWTRTPPTRASGGPTWAGCWMRRWVLIQLCQRNCKLRCNGYTSRPCEEMPHCRLHVLKEQP